MSGLAKSGAFQREKPIDYDSTHCESVSRDLNRAASLVESLLNSVSFEIVPSSTARIIAQYSYGIGLSVNNDFASDCS